VRIDVLGTIRTGIAMRAEPQVIVVDLRDPFCFLGVARIFDEAIRIRDGGGARERRIDADHGAARNTSRT
jgi:hypothetical protein